MPALGAVAEPLVGLPKPVEKPPPVQLVALVQLQLSVRPLGLVNVHDGAGWATADTVTGVQGEQLLLSFDSVITPGLPAEDLSAQVRT